MSMKKRYHLAVTCLLCCALLLTAGCGNKNTTPQNSGNNNSQNMTTPAPTGDNQNNNSNAANPSNNADQNNAADTNTMSDMNERADKIAQAIVDGVDDVEDARVLISEHMAYVAVKIKDTDPAGEAEAVKEAVIKTAKDTDSDLTDVYVSESADVFTRINQIGDDITEGKPISGFMEELENLFVRITPSK